jgi:hypothetical protein
MVTRFNGREITRDAAVLQLFDEQHRICVAFTLDLTALQIVSLEQPQRCFCPPTAIS